MRVLIIGSRDWAGADVCLAFIHQRSRGATHCARLALEAGIEPHVWRQP